MVLVKALFFLTLAVVVAMTPSNIRQAKQQMKVQRGDTTATAVDLWNKEWQDKLDAAIERATIKTDSTLRVPSYSKEMDELLRLIVEGN